MVQGLLLFYVEKLIMWRKWPLKQACAGLREEFSKAVISSADEIQVQPG